MPITAIWLRAELCVLRNTGGIPSGTPPGADFYKSDATIVSSCFLQ